MADYRKVIAVCGVWLYEEKEYSFITELNRACKEKGYVVMAFNFSLDTLDAEGDLFRERKLMDLLLHLDCAAVIIMGETIKNEMMLDLIKKTVKQMNVPAFSLECHLDGCINIVMKFGLGFKNMVRHVITHHGCRKVNMMAGIRGNEFSEDRIKAYKEVLEENGIPFEEKRLKYGDFWDIPARTATEEFLAEGELPDAIVCANDAMAIACCKVLREHGYKVPKDVIVTGFDGIASGKVNYPPLSTVEPDNETAVSYVFEILEKIEKGEEVDTAFTRFVDYRMRENQSCGCVKNDDKESIEMMEGLAMSLNDRKWHMFAMNKLLLFSNEMKDFCDMNNVLEECLELWSQNLYFVSVYEQFFRGGQSEGYNCDYISDDSCVTMFRHENSADVTQYTPFKEQELMPNIKEIFRTDSGYDMFMIRLLHTQSALYGYLIEGFKNVDERCMRRCEEFGLFLSTTVNAILKNQKLYRLNEKLKKINREMERVSVLDYLTELYNRRGFYDELYKIVHAEDNQGKYLTFFSIDMDGLKIINDTYGHNEGDFALKALAAAIRNFAVRNGICARYGGDEFVCAIVTEQETSFTPDIIRQRFDATFVKNKALQTKPFTISASIGCRCRQIQNMMNLDEMMKQADEDMYKDKLSRRKNRT